MSMPKKFAVVALLLMAAACEATYYKVTDSATGREYYTHDYVLQGRCDRIQGRQDRREDDRAEPQVLEIDEQTFEAGVAATAR